MCASSETEGSRTQGVMTQGHVAATCCSHKIMCCSHIEYMFVCTQCDFVATTCVLATRPYYMSPTRENTILLLQHVAGTGPCVMIRRVREA